jgi:radical SAM-linked protein
MSFGPALSLGFASYGEYMDIDLSAPWPSEAVMDGLNRELPDGLTIVEAEAHGLEARTIDHILAGFTYSISLEQFPPGRLPDEMVAARLAEFWVAATFPITKRIKGVSRVIDARASVTIDRTGPRTLQVHTSVTRTGTLKPHHVIASILSLSDLETQLLAVTKIGTLLVRPPHTRRARVAACSPTVAAP